MAYPAGDLPDECPEPYIDPVTELNNIDAILEDSRSGRLPWDDGDDDFWI